MVQSLAPPQSLFLITLPAFLQALRCLQVVPSGIPKCSSRSQSNWVETWTSTTENSSMSLLPLQLKDGHFSGSGWQTPVMCLLRAPPRRSTRERRPLSDAHEKPLQEKSL